MVANKYNMGEESKKFTDDFAELMSVLIQASHSEEGLTLEEECEELTKLARGMLIMYPAPSNEFRFYLCGFCAGIATACPDYTDRIQVELKKVIERLKERLAQEE
jgi:hypothetical protein